MSVSTLHFEHHRRMTNDPNKQCKQVSGRVHSLEDEERIEGEHDGVGVGKVGFVPIYYVSIQ